MNNYHQNEFFNKNIVITGASSGIGLSSTFYFLNKNANLILVCQDVVSMTKICKQNNFLNAAIIKSDLEKEEDIEHLLSFITKLFPKIDILINCAAIKFDGDVEKTYEQDFNYTINTNLRSIFLIIQKLHAYLSDGASIINLSCLYGTRPMYGVLSYAISKAGLETLTRYAAAEFANLNIRINAISACPVDTNSFRYVKVSEEEIYNFKKKMENNIPLGRIAKSDDIVKVIIFLASKRSDKITGQVIKVDGGRSLTSSGYLHYKGIRNMNIKYEPDYYNIKNYIEKYFNKEKKILNKPITDKEELKKFIYDTIIQSNFTTRDVWAHFSITSNYYKVNEIDSTLTSRYLKGSIPNKLLIEKKGSNFGTMSYNPIRNTFKEINNNNEMFYSKMDNRKFEIDNFNFCKNNENINKDKEFNIKNEEDKINKIEKNIDDEKKNEVKKKNNNDNNENIKKEEEERKEEKKSEEGEKSKEEKENEEEKINEINEEEKINEENIKSEEDKINEEEKKNEEVIINEEMKISENEKDNSKEEERNRIKENNLI